MVGDDSYNQIMLDLSPFRSTFVHAVLYPCISAQAAAANFSPRDQAHTILHNLTPNPNQDPNPGVITQFYKSYKPPDPTASLSSSSQSDQSTRPNRAEVVVCDRPLLDLLAIPEYVPLSETDRSHIRPLLAFPSLQEVSQHFHLNRLQHKVFFEVGTYLLQKFLQQSTCAIPKTIVVGAGGTGKSRILNALRALSELHQHPGAVAILAPSGVAASAVNGETIESALGLGYGKWLGPA